MADYVSVELTFTPLYKNLVEKFERAIVHEGFAAADAVLAPIAQAEFIRRLPDGTESRKKQSKTTAARFPNHMKQHVRIKRLRDRLGMASIIGTTTEVGQTHFDFGKKAKTTGRVHILWGKRPANPPSRIQRKELQDLPEQVGNHIASIAENVVIAKVSEAIARIN
jgi:hypothetical protein